MNKTRFFLPILLFVLLSTTMAAQQRNSYGTAKSRGSIEIIGDASVEQLVEKHIELSERTKTIPGYRIQIASLSGTNAKTNAFALKERFKQAFSGIEVYISYDEPNFRIKVGDFKTRLEAYAFLQRIKDIYPGTIMRDDIYPIRLDWSEMIPESDDDI